VLSNNTSGHNQSPGLYSHRWYITGCIPCTSLPFPDTVAAECTRTDCSILGDIYKKIKWRGVSEGFHAAFLRGFSTATTALSEQKQTVMLHLFTAPSKTLCCQRLGGHCAQIYDLVFTVTPSAQYTDLRGVSVGNAIIIAGSNPVNTREKYVVPARRYCGSFLTSGTRSSHCQLQLSLDWMRQARGLAS
jgi:hypothetical protein